MSNLREKNEFDIHKIIGENFVKSFIYVYMGKYMSKHTLDSQASLKKTRKNKRHNPEKMLKKLPTLNK